MAYVLQSMMARLLSFVSGDARVSLSIQAKPGFVECSVHASHGGAESSSKVDTDTAVTELPSITLVQLPSDMLLLILRELTAHELCSAASTCSAFLRLLDAAVAARSALLSTPLPPLRRDEPQTHALRLLEAISDRRRPSVAAGSAHTLVCGLRAAGGALVSWGGCPDDYNDFLGHLGHGRVLGEPVQLPADVLPTHGARIAAVSAGDYHSAAMSVQGTVYTWGRGAFDLLGRVSADSSSDVYPLPLILGRDDRVHRAASSSGNGTGDGGGNGDGDGAGGGDGDGDGGDGGGGDGGGGDGGGNEGGGGGGDGSSGVAGDSTPDSTGVGDAADDEDMHGDEHMDDDIGVSSPRVGARLQQLPSALQLSCGPSHTLMLTRDGGVYSWGWGENGKLGHGIARDEAWPRRVRALDALVRADAAAVGYVSAGEAYSLALCSGGGLIAWGQDEYGRLGLGPNREAELVLLPVRVALPNTGAFALRLSQACASRNHSLLVAVDGTLLSCGSGDLGMLGHDDTLDVAAPKPIAALLRERVRVIAAAAGANHSVALSTRGDVYTFGLGNNGALGLGHFETVLSPRRVCSLNESVAEVAAGAYHTVLRLRSGRVVVFGEGRKGQLGRGDLSKSCEPRQVLDKGEELRRLRDERDALLAKIARLKHTTASTHYEALHGFL